MPTGAVAGTDPDSRQVPSSRPRPGCTRRGKIAVRLRRRAIPSHTLPSRDGACREARVMRSDGVVGQQLVGCMHDVGFWLCRGRNLVGSGDGQADDDRDDDDGKQEGGCGGAQLQPVQPAHVPVLDKKSPSEAPSGRLRMWASQNASTALSFTP